MPVNLVCLLLAAVSAVLSISYSGAMPVIFGGGSESGALDTGVLCAIIAVILAIVAVLLLLKKKKFAAIPLFIASGVQAYVNLRVETPYPYLLASVALYAFAGLGSLLVRPKAADETPKAEGAGSEVETETSGDENTSEIASVEPEKKPRRKWRCPCSCNGPCLLLGVLLAIAAAGVSLCYSGVWQQISAGGIKLTGLKEYAALDPLARRVIAAAAIALLATLFHLGRRTFSALLFFASAGILASVQYGLKIEYPHWDVGVILYLLAAFRAEYVGIAAMKNVPPRRYSWAYVYGFIFAIAASFIALYQSGICPCQYVSGGLCAFADAFLAMDCRTQIVLLISALGILGGVMSFLTVPYASWVLLGTMLLGLVAEIVCGSLYAYSWLSVALFAIAGLCSAAVVRVDAPLPVKRLSIAGAVFLMFLAAFAGSALTLYATKGDLAKTAPGIVAEVAPQGTSATEEIAEPENEPEPEQGTAGTEEEIAETEDAAQAEAAEGDEEVAKPENGSQTAENDERVAELENQILVLMTENDAKIAELENQIQALAADRDEQVKNLTDQSAAKDEEIASLNAAAAESAGKISELENQIGTLTADRDAQAGSLTDQTAAKDEEIAKLNVAAAESAGKISELENQIGTLTADRDEQVKNLTEQSAAKDEEIANLNAAAAESAEKISALQKQLDEKPQQEAASTGHYIFVRGRANVRNVPHANAGSKIISRLTNEVAEVLEVTHPEDSTGNWYRIEGSFGTGWVFGGETVYPFEVKK